MTTTTTRKGKKQPKNLARPSNEMVSFGHGVFKQRYAHCEDLAKALGPPPKYLRKWLRRPHRNRI